jgi:hypothetical protein
MFVTRRAVAVQPLNPEARGLLGEILGYSGNTGAMQTAINEAALVFDAVDRTHVSEHSLASVYHKLATTYLTVKRPRY